MFLFSLASVCPCLAQGYVPVITEGNNGQRNLARSPNNMKILKQSAENEVFPLRMCKQSGQFVLAAQMIVTRLTEVFTLLQTAALQ